MRDRWCTYPGHRHSHCDCPWWRRWWYRGERYTPGVSGTVVMPKVTLPEGYVPPSAAVPPPAHSDGDVCAG